MYSYHACHAITVIIHLIDTLCIIMDISNLIFFLNLVHCLFHWNSFVLHIFCTVCQKKIKNLKISCLLLYDSIECVWPDCFLLKKKSLTYLWSSLVHVIYWTLEMLAIFSKLHVLYTGMFNILFDFAHKFLFLN